MLFFVNKVFAWCFMIIGVIVLIVGITADTRTAMIKGILVGLGFLFAGLQARKWSPKPKKDDDVTK